MVTPDTSASVFKIMSVPVVPTLPCMVNVMPDTVLYRRKYEAVPVPTATDAGFDVKFAEPAAAAMNQFVAVPRNEAKSVPVAGRSADAGA